MTDSTLSVGVDSSGVRGAAADLDKFVQKGNEAAKTTAQIERAVRSAAGGAEKLAVANKLSAAQAQQLSFQLNDLFVQIASGGSPLTALIQQGSQLNGTFGGLGGTLRALGTLFTTTRVLVGGAVGAVAGLAVAFAQGDEQSRAFAKSIILTGGAAGITEGQFNSLAKSIADTTNTTIGSSRESLQALVSTGRLSGAALTQAATATQLLAKVTGQSVESIVTDLTRAADAPAKFAEQANRSYNFLSAAQLRYVRDLEDQGQKQKALEVTLLALNERLTQSATKVGLLEGAYNGLKRAASAAADALLSIGRETTAEEKLANINRELENRAARGPLNSVTAAAFERGNAALQGQKTALEAIIASQQRSATEAAKAVATERSRVDFDKLREQSLTRQEKLTKELADANAIADKAGASAADRAKVLAGIREKYKSVFTDAATLDKARLDADLAAIESALQKQTDAYSNAQSIIEALRAADLLDSRYYYDAKRKFVQETADAQVAAYRQEIDRIQAQKASGKDLIENQEKVAKLEAKIAAAQADASAKTTVLGVQQAGAINKVTAAFVEAKASADAYLATLAVQSERNISAVGLGDEQRRVIEGLNAIDDAYTQRREKLQSDKRLGAYKDDEDGYERDLKLLAQTKSAEIDIYIRTNEAIKAQQGDFRNGATRALQNYLNDAANLAQQTDTLFTNALSSTEEALVKFVTTGKLSIKSLADTIISELARIVVKQQVSGLAGLLAQIVGTGLSISTSGNTYTNSTGDSLPTAGGRAGGGSVSKGSLYQVNEKGPELLTVGGRDYLLMGGQGGNITPNGGGGGIPNVTVNVVGGQKPDRVQSRQDGNGNLWIDLITDQIEKRMGARISQGYGLAKDIEGRYGGSGAVNLGI